jgi:hypothetical protein
LSKEFIGWQGFFLVDIKKTLQKPSVKRGKIGERDEEDDLG